LKEEPLRIVGGANDNEASKATLGWGLIGCGDIARKRVVPALRDLSNSNLVAVSRARADLAEAFAAEFGVPRWYEKWQDLLDDSEVDAVYIATPVHLHVEQACAAAEAGKHVLCEKPMALSVTECDRMIAACRSAGVKLGVAYYRHFYPLIHRIKELIAAGEIGQPIVAQVNAFELFNPPSTDPRNWLLNAEKSGGGPMFDFGCHRIEVLEHLFGRITYTLSLLTNVRFAREVEDTGIAVFHFATGPNAVLTVTHAANEPQDTLDIFGSEGSLHVASLNGGELKITTQAGDRVENHPAHSNLHLPLIDDFARAVVENRKPQVTGEMGRRVAIVEAEIYGQKPQPA
jgi:predicted dehydrogenase